MRKALLVMFLLLACAANAKMLNAKTIESVEVNIIQSGVLRTSGDVHKANISYYIPQDGVTSVNVVADGSPSWRYTYDEHNNRLVLIEWSRPSGIVNYRIEVSLRNNAKHTYSDVAVGTNDLYLQQTKYVKISDAVRQMAFPYEKSMRRAAELTKFVYDYIDYDLSYVGKNVPSDQVLIERRGVCVEHANLLAALLRANEIPTRYVVGYAYSSVQDQFIGHTWLEVFAADGSWVPLDPTWLQAGYIDATHIKSAELLDNNQIDTLTYIGGRIDWTRNEEEFELLDYTEKNVTSIVLDGTDATTSEAYGYIKADISSNECTIAAITALSCVDDFSNRQLDIYDQNRSVWLCAPKEIYWFFKAHNDRYICPVSVFDQTGSVGNHAVTVKGRSDQSNLFISGPDTAGINDEFTLRASENGMFYSPDFGMYGGQEWRLKINKPGAYRFYLYGNGLYIKTVNVVQRKEFELSVAAPAYAQLGGTFEANVTVKNVLESGTNQIKAQYANQTFLMTEFLEKDAEKRLSFEFTANMEGVNDLVVSVSGNSLMSDTLQINTPGRPKNVIDNILEFLSSVINSIIAIL